MNEIVFDHVKHLRNIHFWLLATCLVLLTVAVFIRQSDVDKAYEDIVSIRTFLSEGLGQNSNWINEYGNKIVADYIGKNSLKYQPMPETIIVGKNKDAWTIPLYGYLNSPHWLAPSKLITTDVQGTAEGILTLAAFKRHWNVLKRSTNIFLPSLMDRAVVYSDETKTFRNFPILVAVPEVKATRFALPLAIVSTDGNDSLKGCWGEGKANAGNEQAIQDLSSRAKYVLCPLPSIGSSKVTNLTIKRGSIFIPVSAIEISLNPLRRLIELAKEGSWRERSFSHAFRELDTITKDYQNIALERIEVILKSERQRAGGKLNVFGTDLSAGTTREWGTPVILGIQIYLLLHLMAFLKAVPNQQEAWSMPWIALYDSTFAKLVFGLTGACLPVLTIVVLIWRTWYLGQDSLQFYVITSACAGGSLVVAIFTILETKKIWELRPQAVV